MISSPKDFMPAFSKKGLDSSAAVMQCSVKLTHMEGFWIHIQRSPEQAQCDCVHDLGPAGARGGFWHEVLLGSPSLFLSHGFSKYACM